MRLILFITVAFICNSCCDGPTCPSPDLLFRVVDTNNKDLRFDLNIPLDSIILKSKSGDVFRLDEYNNKYDRLIVAHYIDPNTSDYTVSYKDRSTSLMIVWEHGTTECCQEGFVVPVGVLVAGVDVPRDQENDSRTFIIPL